MADKIETGATAQQYSRRDLFRRGLKGAAAVGGAVAFGALGAGDVSATTIGKDAVPWDNGMYQTFPRVLDQEGQEGVLQHIDLGKLGPDVDTIFGIDFPGDVPTGALVIHQPNGEIKETRVVGIRRADLETVQFQGALGGDRFDVWRVSKFGGAATLDAMAKLHAQDTAREHQKVVYIGDLGLFENQWGQNEGSAGSGFLPAIIRAQRPAKPSIGIPAPDFVQERQ